jgi:hypothetical protein
MPRETKAQQLASIEKELGFTDVQGLSVGDRLTRLAAFVHNETVRLEAAQERLNTLLTRAFGE